VLVFLLDSGLCAINVIGSYYREGEVVLVKDKRAYRGVEVQCYFFFKPGYEECGWSISLPDRFAYGKEPLVPDE